MKQRTPSPQVPQGLEVEQLLTPQEVATMFRVDPKTVTRWAKLGRLRSIRTLGGHRRYSAAEVRALLTGAVPVQVPQHRPAASKKPPVQKTAGVTVGVETANTKHQRKNPHVQLGESVVVSRQDGTITGVMRSDADKAESTARRLAELTDGAVYVGGAQ